MDLTEPLQEAPIFNFCVLPDGKNTNWLASGNFYGVIPYEGRYDALQPSVFSFKTNTHNFSKVTGLPFAEGEMRDAKWIKTVGGQQLLVLARNNKEYASPCAKRW